MPKQIYKNNSATTLSASTASGTGVTSMTVVSGAPLSSPAGGQWQLLTLTDAAGGNIEIVKMTARSGNVLTVVRGQEGTATPARSAGDKVEGRVTADTLTRLVQNHNTASGIAMGDISSGDSITAYSVAIGTNPVAADLSVAIGYVAESTDTEAVAIGVAAKAHGVGAVALGRYSVAYRANQFAVNALHSITRNYWGATYGMQYNSSCEATWAGQFFDLGTPATWAPSTAYIEGSVVIPTVPNGFQYTHMCEYFDSTVVNYVSSDATEPTWPLTIGGDVGVDADYTAAWLAADLAVGADEIVPPGMTFYPTEVGFICFNHSGVVAAPFVSVGTVADPTLFVNNQQLTSITGAAQRHAFTGLKHGVSTLRFRLNAAATGVGARFHGRFYAKGIVIQTQG